MNATTTHEPKNPVPTTAPLVPCTIDANGIATVRLGRADESVVTFTRERLLALGEVLSSLRQNRALRGVIIAGSVPGMFCAGADINLIHSIASVEEGTAAANTGREVFQLCRQLPVPVVAAIEGPCVGGGCELALFCDLRVASDHPATQIGLPETKLGIVPGFGGTQNMARLIGLPNALDMILAGKLLKPVPAKKKGLVDRVVPSDKLLSTALAELQKLIQQGKKAPKRKLRGAAFWFSKTPLRAIAARAARKALSDGPAKFYPAPRLALELCLQAFTQPVAQGFAAEARALGEMIASPVSKALTHLFFLTERSKRLGKQPGAADLSRGLIVGGGVMGAGIASLLAQKGLRVRLCDLNGEALAKAKARLQEDLTKRLKRRHMERHEAQAVQDRLAVSSDWGSLVGVDLFLEAVVEDLAVKRKLMSEAVARGLPADAIIATNTSSLPVFAMAETVPNPERVVGIHFFNPPEKMPLIEVIRGKHTSDAAVATACRLAVRLGKFPIVVQDTPGFLVNRCLAPYLNEASRLLLEGNEPEFIDRVMLDFGMPMGPCRLLDEVGFDVATKVSEVMSKAFASRMQPTPLFAAMVEKKALGKKSGGGIYAVRGNRPGPGVQVIERLRKERGMPTRQASRSEVLQRLIYPMIDEAYRCLDEKIVAAEQDLDLGLVMGIGFPPFLGGVTGFAQREGLKTIVLALDELARKTDPRFQPSDGLRRRSLA
ncbi:MAG: 3-hydroxyacyl-CoA dehydrogenase NAD-binding domain-containing protein [Planctomycetota bacterium]|nr:3-hydroxyacyl-CoA dehydrogenase NAD-binding domain-containing protein [Planctomycetota bacterium]